MKNSPAKATKSHELYQKLLTTIKMGRMAGVMLGKYLFELKANNAYQQAVGEGIETWVDFLKMPEVSIPASEATRAMEIYEEFCLRRGYSLEMLAEAGTKTMHYLLPIAKKYDIEEPRMTELIQAGANLPLNSFRERLQDFKGGERHYEFMVMRKCKETGTMQKVHDITTEMIVEAMKKNFNINLTEQLLPEII